MTHRTFVLADALVVTMNDRFELIRGDVWVEEGVIRGVGVAPDDAGPRIDCAGDIVLPGLVQAHIHLCQTLFRHEAESRNLLAWLRDRIWPLEGAHTPHTLRVSAELGVAELLASGTTCLLDMGTVHHTEVIAETLERSGIRAMFGKAMMDLDAPPTLAETTQASIDASIELAREWHGADHDRLRYAMTPRFVLSCTEELNREVGRLSRRDGYGIHTHSSEQEEEIAIVESRYGERNVHVLDRFGLCSPRSVFAHGVHLDASERSLLARTGTTICHCPSSNLKLGSGVADPVGLLRDGVNVAIGADGAPCNNGLDAFVEMRLAHLLQCVNLSPGAFAPREVLRIATRGGARALGWDDRIGSVEVGKDADLVRLRRDDWRLGLDNDPYTEIVCAGTRDLVRDVWVRGRQLVSEGQITSLDTGGLRDAGIGALKTCVERAFG